jgi:hypothetical protein
MVRESSLMAIGTEEKCFLIHKGQKNVSFSEEKTCRHIRQREGRSQIITATQHMSGTVLKTLYGFFIFPTTL